LKVLGKTNFVGGVSDGYHGVTAQDFRAALKGTLAAKYEREGGGREGERERGRAGERRGRKEERKRG
jgi:hypothetical protein